MKFNELDLISDHDKLSMLVRKAAFSIGVTKAVDQMEVNFIGEFMIREFPHLTLEKFEDAFSKAAANKFDTSIESYNNFSLSLVGKVMRAYREYAAKEQLKTNVSDSKQLPETTPKTTDQKGEQHWQYFQEFIESGEMPSVGQWATALNWGVKNEKIFITTEELTEFKQGVMNDLQREAKELQRTDRDAYNQVMSLLNDTKELRRECQNRYMREWVKAQII